MVYMYGSCSEIMQNLFGRPHLNRFCIISKHNPYLLTMYIVLFLFCFIQIQNILSTFWSFFFSLFIFLVKFVVSYIISFSYSKQTSFSDHKNSFYSVSLHLYKEYLHAKICGSCLRNCTKHIRVVSPKYSVQFLEHDPHIFAFLCVIINYYKLEYNSSLSSLFIVPIKAAHHLL